MNRLQGTYGQRFAFAGVDYDNKGLVQKYRVLGHPTFIALDPSGNVVKRFVGYAASADLEAALKQAIGGQ